LLAEKGLTVLMPDRRGSGMNREQRGHAASADQCLSDVKEMLDLLLRTTGLPTAHVVGVSWGGKMAAALAAASPSKVRTLTLISPGLFPKVDMTAAAKVRVALALVNDRHRLFDIPLNDPRLFTANPERIAWLEHDELMLRQVSASFLLASRHLDRRARQLRRSGWRGGVHLFLAGRDKIINNERTREWLAELGPSDAQTTAYPDGEHTLEFEADNRPFLDAVVDWIVERC
jgi:alpha-beta hydrolase superfamily lysophospholipase